MATPKSVKLRNLIMLHTLFKHSDATHPVDWEIMNQHLRPYDLDCDRRSMNDTLETLEKFGIKVSHNTSTFTCKVWLEDRPLSDSDISSFAFALTTNPYISQKQAAKLLEKLKPFVTVYQEPLLSNNVVWAKRDDTEDSQWRIYAAIQEACSQNCKIQYTKKLSKYDKDKKCVTMEESVPIWFSPKCFYRNGTDLYLVGFKRSNLFPEAIDLKDIASVRFPKKTVNIKAEQLSLPFSEIISGIDMQRENRTIVYQGPVTFRCRGSCLQRLYLRFGPPSDSMQKDARSIITYPVENITLSSEDLFWLSQTPGFGIRIIGPENAVEAVRAYYNRSANNLTDPFFHTIEQNITKL